MLLRQIREPFLSQYAYLVGCQTTGEAIIIDPQRDVDRYFAAAEAEGLRLVAAAETHIHADYVSGLRALAETHGLRVYASAADADWRYEWLEGSDLDFVILRDGDTFRLGNVEFDVLHTPGHTPEHLTYLIVDRAVGDQEGMGLLTGDFVFVGDVGRPDLLESAAGMAGRMRPAARDLYRSIQQFKTMPVWLQVWPGHGAGSACGKALGAVPQSTVGYELQHNASIAAAQHGEETFVDAILQGQPAPPLYFARMKKLNRKGAPLLPEVPAPRALSESDLESVAGRPDVTLIDTRPRHRFLDAHLTGALHAVMDTSFCATVGSYADPEAPVYLIVDDARLDDAVRCLFRIGIDRIEGFATLDVAEAVLSRSERHQSIRATDFEEVRRRKDEPGTVVLDVRSRDEYNQGHIDGALNIPHTRLRERLAEIPRDKELLVHCATGVRSAVASAFLQSEGWRVVYVEDDWRGEFGDRR
ncbi:MAG TPA: MBL fold metallo-hydrolase [Rhodothermales bacterium]